MPDHPEDLIQKLARISAELATLSDGNPVEGAQLLWYRKPADEYWQSASRSIESTVHIAQNQHSRLQQQREAVSRLNTELEKVERDLDAILKLPGESNSGEGESE